MIYQQQLKEKSGVLPRVVHLSQSDRKGGAALAASRLHQGLQRAGYSSSLFVCDRVSDDPNTIAFQPAQFQELNPIPTVGGYLFTDDRSPYQSEILHQLPDADIVHLHWVAGFVDYAHFLSNLAPVAPIVWTLHDTNPFTGGCHGNVGCDRFTVACGACPQLGSTQESDRSREIWQRKDQALKKVDRDRLHIVTPSQWLADRVKESSLLREYPLTVIPNALDLEVFAPRDRAFSREILGIPPEAKVLLFAANYLEDPYKNFPALIEAIEQLPNIKNIFLLSVGRGTNKLPVSLPYLHLGYINQPRFLSLIYSAADLFVLPSKQDNFPNVCLEAIACGLPVVAFPTGGIPEMVRSNVTGLLASEATSKALSRAIATLLQAPQHLKQMRHNCREIALKEYNLEQQAQCYSALYQQHYHDAIVLGEGWHPLETYEGKTFQWVTNDAQFSIKNPTGLRTTLRLNIEPGPSLIHLPLELYLCDRRDRIATKIFIQYRTIIFLQLSISPNQNNQFRLHLENKSQELTTDPRILNFRVFSLGWS
ncbi:MULTISPECIES: glycosyltransferase family 4 protein [Spirulina sp. CCY15215]|uniref:glycosyltransferase family 4 protein n=1 Tax=Spirulina sp. CCY15215 TaxID=2767591 RepID=UPI00194FBE8B|nr:glycosyltransferase family 4 protein [Spirulina major]